MALTSAAADVLARWSKCLQVNPQNLALLQPSPQLGLAVEFQVTSGKFKSDCSQRACDSCLTEVESDKPLRECAACKQAFYCNAGRSIYVFYSVTMCCCLFACLWLHQRQDSDD